MTKKSSKSSVDDGKLKGVHRISKSPNKHRRRYRYGLPLLVGLAAVILGALLLWLLTSEDPVEAPQETRVQNRLDAVQVLGAGNELSLPLITRIDSSLGFTVDVDESLFGVTAQVTDPESTDTFVSGFEYAEGDLSERREYSLVKVRTELEEGRPFAYTPDMTIITNIRESFWDDKVEPGESNLDGLVRWAGRNYDLSDNWSIGSRGTQTVNGTDYVFTDYVQTYTYGDLSTSRSLHQYVTVQNDRPYIVTIGYIDSGNGDLAVQLEKVFDTLSFQDVDATKLSVDGSVVAVLGATDGEEIESVSNTPYDIDQSSIFDVILRNQPAVVRVGAIRCADIRLSGPVSSTTLRDACNGGVGSGSIVSEDGYVATNGHVVTVGESSLLSGYVVQADTEQELIANFQDVSGHLIDNGVMTQAQLVELDDAMRAGFLSASQLIDIVLAAIPEDSISIENEESRYLLQLGSDAIKVDDTGDRLAIVGDPETTVEAELIAQDFEANSVNGLILGDGTSSDVAILKAEGKFPVVRLGSVEGLTAGNQLTAIGYPAFVDGGLTPSSDRTTPTVTQGEVLDVSAESSTKDNILIFTSVPIAQGNSGGPAFDRDGNQIGLNTYGSIDCPDQKCFGSGIARDISDFTSLLGDQDISLDTTSDYSNDWDEALASYEEGNFKGAAKQFDSLDDDYPAHYLATSLQELSESKIGTPGDRSAEFSDNNLLYAIAAASAVLVIGGAGLVIFLLHGSHKANRPQPPILPANPSNQPAVHQAQTPAYQQPAPVVYASPQQPVQAPQPTVQAVQPQQQQQVPPAAASAAPQTNTQQLSGPDSSVRPPNNPNV